MKTPENESGDPQGQLNEQVERLFAGHFLYHRVPQLLKEISDDQALQSMSPRD